MVSVLTPNTRVTPGVPSIQRYDAGRQRAVATALAQDLDGAFEGFVRSYQDRVFGLAINLLRDRQLAEEVAQDTFVRAYRALQSYGAERIRTLALRAWLYRIAINLARNRWRGARRTDVALENGASALVAGEAHDPELAAITGERLQTLRAAVHALPERYRTAVALRHIEELGYAEIAETLGQPVGTVKANVHRGIALLRTALASRGD